MPIYGYDCSKCGHEFEALVRSSETSSCPSCESTDLTRHLSLIAAPVKSGRDAPHLRRWQRRGDIAPVSFNGRPIGRMNVSR